MVVHTEINKHLYAVWLNSFLKRGNKQEVEKKAASPIGKKERKKERENEEKCSRWFFHVFESGEKCTHRTEIRFFSVLLV